MKKNKFVTWKSITPIIADVVISHWNLLIGGLLISKLSFPYALISIFVGYAILSFIFYFYGGLGLRYRKDTSHLLEPVFGQKGNKLFFSFLLAIGQIGWFGIINQIGGESLAVLLHVPPSIGIILYAIIMFGIASMSLYKTGIVKTLILLSSLSLIIYLISIHLGAFTQMSLWNGSNQENILWGVAVIIASFISFSSITPDFTSQLQTKKDLLMTVCFGLFLPGMLIVALGAILFFQQTTLSLATIIGISSIATFGHIFNVITNTDSSVAIYTPGKRIQYILQLPFIISLATATIIGTALSLLHIQNQLEIWLSFLAGVYPGLIGVAIAHYLFSKKRYIRIKAINWKAVIIILFTSTFIFIVNMSLLNWIVGLTAFMLYTAMLGVTIKIYIGRNK